MSTLSITQGFEARITVPKSDAYMTIINDEYRQTYSNVQQGTEGYTLVITAQQTALIPFGTFRFQILSPDGLEDYGECKVIANYSLLSGNLEYRSQYQILLQAVQDVLAGRATSAEYSISIDGKQIQYLSLDQLLKLQEYYKQKVEQQNGRYKKGNQGRILYNCNRLFRDGGLLR